MTPPTLVFDLDGTLAETAPDLIDALNFVLAKDQIAPVPVEAARGLVGAVAAVTCAVAGDCAEDEPERFDAVTVTLTV